MIPTRAQMREMADAAQSAAEDARRSEGEGRTYRRVYDEAVEDVLRYLAGDIPLAGELEVIIGHVTRKSIPAWIAKP